MSTHEFEPMRTEDDPMTTHAIGPSGWCSTCGAYSCDPQPAAGDLEREVRAALLAEVERLTEKTTTCSPMWLVPVVVRLIEEQRVPLIAVLAEEKAEREASERLRTEDKVSRLTAWQRAEKAEARVRELESALTAKPESLQSAVVSIKRGNDHLLARAERAEAAVARIRALCDEAEKAPRIVIHGQPNPLPAVRTTRIRAALKATETTR
jgi:hypothetical protein